MTSPFLRPGRAILIKTFGIGVLLILLQIPLFLTENILAERRGYQEGAKEEIASVWGRQQTVVGPVVRVPYTYQMEVSRDTMVNGRVVTVSKPETYSAHVYLLPENLAIEAEPVTEVRRRGIYETVVYSATVALRGAFVIPEEPVTLPGAVVAWDQAEVFLGVCDLRGLRNVSEWINPDGSRAEFASSSAADAPLPLSAPVRGLAPGGECIFTLRVELQGSERLAIAPTGRTTHVQMESAWADPSFTGAFLPHERDVGPEGFFAQWQTSHFSHGFPQRWDDREVASEGMLGRIQGAAYGVEFRQMVNGYRWVERAQKYALLIFVLVFAVVFLFEATARLRIHPLQYALVGAALCLFYLAFLALSEIWPIAVAYALSGAACTLMIALYAWTVLKSGMRAAVLGAGLGLTYGYLYFVLGSEDYALLAGTAALFGVLALLMYGTRRMTWYGEDLAPAAVPPPLPTT